MISKKAKYGINALLHLGRQFGTGPVRVSEIASENNIPQKFLEAILLELKNAGILGSKKGHNGGYYLLKKPAEVNLAQILRLLDGAIALVPCASFNYYERCEECRDEATCSIREAFLAARNETVKLFKGQTLKHLVDREHALTLSKRRKTKK